MDTAPLGRLPLMHRPAERELLGDTVAVLGDSVVDVYLND